MNATVVAASPVRWNTVAPREYRGNMCGVRVPGLPLIPGGALDASLVISWFIDRYDALNRVRIYNVWRAKGIVDVAVSWPDSRDYGFSEAEFVNTCSELVAHGFLPCVFLSSKYYDPADTQGILRNCVPVLRKLIAEGVAPRAVVGWELSLWLQPVQVQELIDALAAECVPHGVKLYVHFQEGYFAFQKDKPGSTTAEFWNQQVGKLTGVLHQKTLAWDDAEYQARIVDCLERFAGGYGFVTDSGFGHPFDFIAYEITAMLQFDGTCSEDEGNRQGQIALNTPPVKGVRVMGSGNGQ